MLARTIRVEWYHSPSQLNEVAREACLARVRRGNVSPITVSVAGQFVRPKSISSRSTHTNPDERPPCAGKRRNEPRNLRLVYVSHTPRTRGSAYMHAATIMTVPEDGYSVGGRTIPMIAKMRSHVACQRPPMMSGTRRPSLSMR
jgi:hypothetical protein